MKNKRLMVATIAMTCCFAGCDKDKNEDTPTKASGDVAASGAPAKVGGKAPKPAAKQGKAEAEKLLKKFLKDGTDQGALIKTLVPKPADYAAVFVGDAAAKAKAHYEKTLAKAGEGGGSLNKPGQTELLLWAASSEDIKAWKGNAEKKFPGGYKRIGDKIKPGLTWIRWKFVKPGETLGMAFDGLVFVNGHWAWFPKPWKALR